jgi:glutaredoxin
MKKKNIKTWIIAAVIAAAVIALSVDWGTKQNLDEFAQCLTDNGAVMYGTYWCTYCKAQKADFGESFEFIDYVECTEEKEECIEKEIDGFPTWIIDGENYQGKQPLQKLSELTGCELPEE